MGSSKLHYFGEYVLDDISYVIGSVFHPYPSIDVFQKHSAFSKRSPTFILSLGTGVTKSSVCCDGMDKHRCTKGKSKHEATVGRSTRYTEFLSSFLF